jgi:hypothetical protein
MLQTIEVQIDNNGVIHPIEPQLKLPAGRALLTLLHNNETVAQAKPSTSNNFDNLFGILKATHSVSLEEMEQAISQQGLERFNDCVC